MDKIDKKILNLIQDDAKISNAEIARRLDMAPSGILERVRRLEESGLILGYEARVNHKMLGLSLTSFIQVETYEPLGSREVGELLAKVPGIQEVHAVAGKYCYLVKARVKDSDSHNELIKMMGRIKDVKNARTTIVLETIKESLKLDVD